jgi:hypothetical protein
MLRKITALVALAALGFTVEGAAQTASLDAAPDQLTAVASESLLHIENDEWSLFADEENQLYYVDFATLSVNLNDIVVTRQDGEVVLRDDLFNLPVDTIYEIDFSQYGEGSYTIELRSFTEVIRREIVIE